MVKKIFTLFLLMMTMNLCGCSNNNVLQRFYKDEKFCYELLIEKKEMLIYAVTNENMNNIEIPDYFNSFPITCISLEVNENVEVIKLSKFIRDVEITENSNPINLKHFEVDIENENFISVDGNLYTKNNKTLVYYSPANSIEELVLPEGIVRINKGAFAHNVNLKTVILPNSLKAICSYSFYNCKNLFEIIIPQSVDYIGNYSFKNCNNLTIYCKNSKEGKNWQDKWNIDECSIIWNFSNKII